ncbi:MAG: CHAD domain-containing protein [Armatimonadia bacterium]|nr:CHAD domain-containing protein [Armatimonadia bacterium]
MAKPVHRAKVKATTRAGKAASRILDAKIENVREHVPAAMVGDVDGIHDMRVAVKRLRESMRLFRKLLPTKRRQRIYPQVELLNDTLGEVRERDVLCLDAEELGHDIEDDGGLLEASISAWQSERDEAFTHLLKVWSRMTGEGFFDALEEVARRTKKRGRRTNRLDVERFAYEAIRRAMDRVDERLGPALESEDPALLHRLRIGIKRLKYSMEPFRDFLPLMKEPYKVVSDAQELLGLTHDLDVLRDRLAAHIEAVDDDRLTAAEGVLALLDRRRGERYAQSRQVITVFAEPQFTRSMLDAID